MSDTVNIRIRKIIEYFKLNKNSFSVRIGIKPQTLHNIVDGRLTYPSYEVICSIVSTFVDINERWLLLGEGEMLKENKTETIGNNKQIELLQKNIDDKEKLIRILEKEVNRLEHEAEFRTQTNPNETTIFKSPMELTNMAADNEIKYNKT